MKAIAIFEIDEKVFNELSNEKLSMRLLWNFDTMLVEKSKYFDSVILRPLPEKKEDLNLDDWVTGFNDCLDEISGEQDE